MRGLFSLCLCIFLINQLLFETADAARCPGGYNTAKACRGLGGNNPPECRDYIGPDRVGGRFVKYTRCKHIIVNGRGSSWCCPP
uniref:Candidate secreted effector n=1 Tax=Meloidogyne incognita TaxID=6306 RepID=A0A914MC96_MELIC